MIKKTTLDKEAEDVKCSSVVQAQSKLTGILSWIGGLSPFSILA